MPRVRLLRLALIFGVLGTPAVSPASPKPCRDAHGRVLPCPKPAKSAPKRCKDAAGRFVACNAPSETPHTHP